jgi:hypothetical protein
MRRTWIGALVGAFLGLLLVVLCAVTDGAGHAPMIACFPYAMLLAIQAGCVHLPFLALGLFQFSAYGAVIGWSNTQKKPWRLWLAMPALHGFVAAATFSAAAKEKTFSH